MSQIISNQGYLSESYLPEKLTHREKEEASLSNNLKNFISTLVFGHFGSGKTTAVKHVLERINKQIVTSYIDCAVYQTAYSVLKETVPRSQFIFCRSNYELLKELTRETKQKKFIICLDNFGKLKDKDLIRKLLILNLILVLVTDEEEHLSLLSEDIRAKLSKIRFSPYSTDQVFDILKDRAERSLVKWACSDAILKKIADLSNGDVTMAINLLRQAVLNAENNNKKDVEESDIPKTENNGLRLNTDEKVLLDILRERTIMPAREVYGFYVKGMQRPRCERSFRNYMLRLCSKGLVKAIGEKRGRIYELVRTGGIVTCKSQGN